MALPSTASVLPSSSPNQRAKSWLEPPPKIRTEGWGGGLEPARPRAALERGGPGAGLEPGAPEERVALEEPDASDSPGASAEADTGSSAVSATNVGARWLSKLS